MRVTVVAALLFLGLGPLFHWMADGGIRRAAGRLTADRWRNARRLAIALACAICAGGIGWLLGMPVANLQGNGADWRYSFLAMACLAALTLWWCFRREVRERAEWGFLICALAVGVSLVAIMPAQPNVVWDGAIHFNTANAISYMEGARYDEGDLISLDGVPYVKYLDGEFGNRPDLSLESVDATAKAIDGDRGEGQVYVSDGTLRYESSTWVMPSAIGNLPCGLGLWFGRLLGLPNTGELLCGRLFNLLTYVFLWFFGIRYLRGAKVALVAVALLPTGLFQASNFTYDPWLIAMFGLATCRFIGELQRPQEPLTVSHAAAILVPFALGCLVKAVYFPMALCYFVLRKEGAPGARWGRQAPWRIVLVAIALCLLASFALPFLARGGGGYTDTRGGAEVDSATQLQLMLAEPMLFGRAAATSGLEIFAPPYLADSTAFLPYIPPTVFEAPLGFAYLAILLAAALLGRTGADRPYASAVYKVLGVGGILGAYLFFAASLYIGFTAVGASEVAGFQPKYLVPMLPVLFGVVLDFPGIAGRLGASVRSALPTAYWIATVVYYALFLLLRFVVFFE